MLLLPVRAAVEAVTSSSHLPVFGAIKSVSVLAGSFASLANTGGTWNGVAVCEAFAFRKMLLNISNGLVVLFFLYQVIHYNHVDLSRNQ